jgi:hypothetical protein
MMKISFSLFASGFLPSAAPAVAKKTTVQMWFAVATDYTACENEKNVGSLMEMVGDALANELEKPRYYKANENRRLGQIRNEGDGRLLGKPCRTPGFCEQRHNHQICAMYGCAGYRHANNDNGNGKEKDNGMSYFSLIYIIATLLRSYVVKIECRYYSCRQSMTMC